MMSLTTKFFNGARNTAPRHVGQVNAAFLIIMSLDAMSRSVAGCSPMSWVTCVGGTRGGTTGNPVGLAFLYASACQSATQAKQKVCPHSRVLERRSVCVQTTPVWMSDLHDRVVEGVSTDRAQYKLLQCGAFGLTLDECQVCYRRSSTRSTYISSAGLGLLG